VTKIVCAFEGFHLEKPLFVLVKNLCPNLLNSIFTRLLFYTGLVNVSWYSDLTCPRRQANSYWRAVAKDPGVKRADRLVLAAKFNREQKPAYFFVRHIFQAALQEKWARKY